MQKVIRFALACLTGGTLLATAPAQAQTFPNNGFENWAMRNNTLAPANWQTTDDVIGAVFGAPLPFSLNTISRTPGQVGSYGAKIETVSSPLGGDPVPGVLILGNSISLANPLAGLPFTGRPANLQFYFKVTGADVANDSAQVLVALTRYVNGNQVPIAAATRYLLTPTATYTQVTLPLDYVSNLVPDSVHVIVTSSAAEVPHAGTALFLDDLRLTGTATATRSSQLDAALSVYPNPSASGRFELSATEPALLAAPYTVTDATGRTVLRGAAARPASGRTLDLGPRPAGVYTLQLQTTQGVVTRKLVVQ